LKLVMGELEPDAGSVECGYETYPGYVAQDQKAQIGSHNQTVEAWFTDVCPSETIGFVKGQLGAVLFSGDETDKKLTALSGGEAARLIFAQQVVAQPNTLVLDEPTNHLDLEAIEALVTALKAYDGTLLFVSHDRWFVGELATRIIEITDGGINDFPGTYEEYLERCGDDHLDRQAVLRKARASKRGVKTSKEKGRKRGGGESSERRRKRLEARLELLTHETQQAETRIEALNQLFCAADFYETTPTHERQSLEAEHRALSEKVQELMAEWETLENQIADT
ncbi:MAG: ATP-binding cassette domain-containing protein, partial [Deltaproteobacteria bacterium]|nr:ATP-binding cassette domain-containing protein [Deltaproteobacteria bacterium]